MSVRLVLHTPMPLLPLTTMVADMGQIIVDVNGKGEDCCFYGWGERMYDFPTHPVACLPHHLVVSEDNMTLKWMATTLKALGEQVVVTEYEDWSEVIGLMPILYDDAHNH